MSFLKKFLFVYFYLILSITANAAIFPDGTISIPPITPPGSALDGYAIQAIDIFGTQNQIKIIDQILDSYSPSAGVVNNTDSVVQAISKIGSTLPTNYSSLHITSGSSSTTNLTAFQRLIIIDPSVTGKTAVLPSASSDGVLVGVPYTFIVGSGLVTSNTIAVQTGEYLNNNLNGTYTLTGLLSGWVKIDAITDGSRWFIGK